MVFDEGLTWEKHTSFVRQMAYLSLNKIRRTSSMIDDDTKRWLINALVYPHLSYCVRSNTLSHVMKRFESLGNQIDRITPMNKPFNNLAEYSTGIMTFRSINNICPTYLSDRFMLVRNAHSNNTRAAAQNELTVRNVRNKYDSKTFPYTAAKTWN